ncbi:class I adenylate-forming enzyme family protein [Noviherbaspirillum suwonense]|uniref:Acyl-CoA synthetase (AMP-forming)/AMP-acid ligase II n=1 Tax=Noviherbaspirillum suwonense TaxID=1224511 RepID=A0ABY1QRA3_9BURK|nr:class I adenylate-forming enzyme family protein [Noviherbaspirillum suwonense]SMP76426.1 Acyl-CoA synthetase (AMP-forming)/AMP-acid ligase II [Noviherbaspirillum suwonense]
MILHSTEALKRYTESGHWGRRTLRKMAAKAPERPAVVNPADRPDLTGTAAQSLSYRELSAAVDAIATGLLDMGLRKDESVIVQLLNVWELVAMFLVVSHAGGVLAPMPIQWRANKFQNVKKFADARFFFGMRDFKGANRLAIAEKSGFVALPIERIAEIARGAVDAARLDASVVDGNDIFTLCWSSGTEALSKGGPMSHNNWLFQMNLISQTAGLREGDRVLATAPVVDTTGVATWLASLAIGGTTLLHHSLNMPLLVKQLMQDQVHFLLLVPAVLNIILKLPNVDQLDFSGVRCIASGSAQCSRWSMGEFKRRWNIEILHTWGQTEGTAVFAGARDVPDFAKRADHFPWWGRPSVAWPSGIRGVEMTLFDEADAECTQPGQGAELVYCGPTVFAGYYRQPDLAKSTFTPDGFCRTGDFFILRDAHHIGVFDRKKDIVIRGFNLSVAKVENLVLTHPGVQEAAAVAVPDEIMREKTCIYVVPKDKAQLPTLEAVIGHLKQIGVAAYKLPEHIEYFDTIQRNPVGKILKAQLRQRVRSAAA